MRAKEILHFGWRVLKWNFGDTSSIIATIKLTYRCNLRCIHCAWKDLPCDAEATTDHWKIILSKLYEIGIRIVVFEGGEPTLREDLNDLVEAAKAAGHKVIVFTNGTRRIQDLMPDLFMVSIDGPKEVHEKIRGPVLFEKILDNVRLAKCRKISLTTINSMNKDHILEMMDQINEYFDAFAFNIMYSCTERSKGLELRKHDVELMYDLIKSLSSKYQIINTASMLGANKWECFPWISIFCDPSGKWEHKNACFITDAGAMMDCDICHLACYRGMASLVRGDINTWYILNKYLFG